MRKPERRYRYLPVSVDFLVELQCRGGGVTRRAVCPDEALALPDDVRVVRVGHDVYGMLNIVLSSEEWPALAEGAEIPRCETPILRVVYNEPGDGPCCNATHGGYCCTLQPGHAGRHEASNGHEIIEAWENALESTGVKA